MRFFTYITIIMAVFCVGSAHAEWKTLPLIPNINKTLKPFECRYRLVFKTDPDNRGATLSHTIPLTTVLDSIYPGGREAALSATVSPYITYFLMTNRKFGFAWFSDVNAGDYRAPATLSLSMSPRDNIKFVPNSIGLEFHNTVKRNGTILGGSTNMDMLSLKNVTLQQNCS